MRPSDPFATRAGMISLVIHAAFFFAAVIGAVAFRRPCAAGLGDETPYRGMDISAVELVSSSAPPPAALPRVEPQPVPPAPSPPPAAARSPEIPAAHVAAPADGSGIKTASAQTPPASPPLPAGTIAVFGGVPAVGSTVVFVIDRSASMGLQSRLDRAKLQLTKCLHRLPSTARFQVIPYHRRPEPLVLAGQRGLVPATASNVETAAAAIEQLIPEGGTDHAAAIRAALALNPDVIYFLTDDDDLEFARVQELTRVNRGRACIHTLCFVAPPGDSALPLLAEQNRGKFRVFQ